MATKGVDNLEDVVEQADRIHKLGNKALVLATTASTTSTVQSKSSSITDEQIEALHKLVAVLRCPRW